MNRAIVALQADTQQMRYDGVVPGLESLSKRELVAIKRETPKGQDIR